MSFELETLLQTGEDALSNHFMVIIPPFPGANESILSLNLRVLTISLPGRSLGTYEITKRGRKATRPTSIDETDKEVSFDFRPDRHLRTYNSLASWMNLIQHEQFGTLVPDPIYRTIITVQPIDTAGVSLGLPIIFEGCWINDLSGIEYDEESGDPLSCSVTMQFVNRIQPI
jgi:hypothetical protein